jgi:DNA-directed RNA polymerase subunit H (RpoH/RPB5)
MDMLLTHKTDQNKKVYVKYVNHVRQNNLDVFVDDLFDSESVLNKINDSLIIVSDDEPNDCILSKLEYLYDHDGIFITIFNIKRLQFNILEHSLTPQLRLLSKEEERVFIEKYNIKDISQIPEISRFDPMAMAIGMKPKQIVEIIRNSCTALETTYYRVCV